MTARSFIIPPVLSGPGASDELGSQCRTLGMSKALIVTDKTITSLGMLDPMVRNLDAAGIKHVVFDGVLTEPSTDYVDQGLMVYRDNACDGLIAVGGGSAIDTAKAVSIMLSNSGAIVDYMGAGKVRNRGVPLVAIPTTAGTGSEVTQFTVITDEKTSVKMLISSPYLIPSLAIVDPQLTLSCPAGLSATVGLDALTHAIEAYVSVKAQPLADAYCLAAIRAISGNLRQVCTHPDDLVARTAVMLGALQAGMAFSNSSVALVHGMSRPIGAYFHVAHGASNAVLLGVVTEFSLPGNPQRYADIAAALGVDTAHVDTMQAARQGAEAVKQLIADVKVPPLKDMGVDLARLKELAPQMTRDAIASGSPANNPRQATEAEIIELYMQAYQRQ